jgi:CheY-like chemotaxis protein
MGEPDESVFRGLCDASDEGLLYLSGVGEDLTVSYANPRALSLLQLPASADRSRVLEVVRVSALWPALISHPTEPVSIDAGVGARGTTARLIPDPPDGALVMLGGPLQEISEARHAMNNPLMVMRAVEGLIRMELEDRQLLDAEMSTLLDRLAETTGRLANIVAGLGKPSSPATPGEEAKEDASPDRKRLRGTALVIDDDPDLLPVLDALLTSLGLQVETADSGSTGLQMLADREYDYLITDQQIPDLSGEAIIERAAATLRSTRCFLMTGWAGGRDRPPSTVKIGAREVGLILKPVTRSQLLARLAD